MAEKKEKYIGAAPFLRAMADKDLDKKITLGLEAAKLRQEECDVQIAELRARDDLDNTRREGLIRNKEMESARAYGVEIFVEYLRGDSVGKEVIEGWISKGRTRFLEVQKDVDRLAIFAPEVKREQKEG